MMKYVDIGTREIITHNAFEIYPMDEKKRKEYIRQKVRDAQKK